MPHPASMVFRKWIIRGCSFAGLVGIFALLGGFLTWTSPTVIRNLLIERVSETLIDTRINLDSLQVNLWGGISAQGLRLARNTPFDSPDFLFIPKTQIVHDKEAILEGRLAIRRIDLVQPRLKIIRMANGKFNTDGLFRTNSQDKFHLPAWSVSQGHIVFEDRLPAVDGSHLPNLELRELRGNGIQEATDKIRFEAKGHGDWLGPIEIEGRKAGKNSPLTLDLKLDSIGIKSGLAQVIQQMDPIAANWLRHLAGTVQADIRAEISPEQKSSLPYPRSLLVSLRDGSWQLPIGGIRVENLEGELEGDSRGIQQIEVRGKWKGAQIKANLGSWDIPWDLSQGKWTSPGIPQKISGEVLGVELSREFILSLPPGFHGAQDFFQPRGKADIFFHVVKKEPGSSDSFSQVPDFDLEIHPLGMSFICKTFPYPLRNCTGKINCQVRNGELRGVDMDVNGLANGDAPIHIRAKGRGRNGHEALDVIVEAKNTPIDATLRTALAKPQQDLFDQFQPKGKIDILARSSKVPGLEKLDNDIEITFHEAITTYRGFPYRLEGVKGTLKVKKGNWFCEGFEGHHGTGTVRVDGRSWQPEELGNNSPGTIRLLIRGDNLAADEQMRAALDIPTQGRKKTLAHTWDELNPTGTISVDTDIVDRPDQPGGMDVGLTVRDATLTPRMIPYTLSQVKGKCDIQGNIAKLTEVSASHNQSKIRLKTGQILLPTTGEVKLRFEGLSADPMHIDSDFVKSLPAPLKRGLQGVKIDGEVGIQCDLAVEFPSDDHQSIQTDWNGQVAFRGNKIDSGLVFEKVKGTGFVSGKHNGQTWNGVKGNIALDDLVIFDQKLEQAFGRFEVLTETPSTLRLQDLQGRLHGGQIGGDARIDFAATTRYDLLFRATQIRLEDFSRSNFGDSAQMQGLAAATLHLSGIGTDLNGLRGYGSIDVPQGKLYKLPPVLDLIKTLGLRVPDGTAFEQVHALYSVEGPLLRFQQLDLFGNAISLRGKGTVPLDGRDMSLEFRTDWARINQFLPQGVDSVPKAISEQLFLVRIQGNPKSPKIERDVLPGLTQPFRNAFRSNPASAMNSRRGGQ